VGHTRAHTHIVSVLRLLRFKLLIFQQEERIILYTEIQTSLLKLLTKNFAADLFHRMLLKNQL
jgi:hypothetical protein